MGQAVNLLCNKQIAVNDQYRENYDRIFGTKGIGHRANKHGSTFVICPDSKNLKRISSRVCMRCAKRAQCSVYQQQMTRLMGFRY